jgi:hypothetical protein
VEALERDPHSEMVMAIDDLRRNAMMNHLVNALDRGEDDYNPPRRERILEWDGQQSFPICPDSDGCNV